MRKNEPAMAMTAVTAQSPVRAAEPVGIPSSGSAPSGGNGRPSRRSGSLPMRSPQWMQRRVPGGNETLQLAQRTS